MSLLSLLRALCARVLIAVCSEECGRAASGSLTARSPGLSHSLYFYSPNPPLWLPRAPLPPSGRWYRLQSRNARLSPTHNEQRLTLCRSHGPCAKPPAEVLLSLSDLRATTRLLSSEGRGGGSCPKFEGTTELLPPTPQLGWAALLCVCGDCLPGGRGSKHGRRFRTRAPLLPHRLSSYSRRWVCNHQQIQIDITLPSGEKQQKQNKKALPLSEHLLGAGNKGQILEKQR